MSVTLVIDVGGSGIKWAIIDDRSQLVEHGKITITKATPTATLKAVKTAAKKHTFDQVTIGIPGICKDNQVISKPVNLGNGWKGYDFKNTYGKPTKVINDAAMQAFGSYPIALAYWVKPRLDTDNRTRKGNTSPPGRVLFLGLGTGLGSALLISDGDNFNVLPLEVGHLPYRDKTFEGYVGKAAKARLGEKKWAKHVIAAINILNAAFLADVVVVGGGNAKSITDLPEYAIAGDNNLAFWGGQALWDSPDARRLI